MCNQQAVTGSARVRRGLLAFLSRPVFSRLFGRIAETRHPRFLVRFIIKRFVAMYNIDCSEVERSMEAYQSLGDFFIRKLKPGVRPVVTDPDTVVSPVDAAVLTVGTIDSDGRAFQIKGRSYTVSDLLPEGTNPDIVAGGTYIQLYLSPRDYHRIHHPADGRICRAMHVPGRLYPVNHFSLNHFDSVLVRNERILLELDCHGRTLFMALVGALNVGRIGLTASPFETNRGIRADTIPLTRDTAIRGAELGWFRMGSTVVMLAPPDTLSLSVSMDERVRMGEAIGRWR